MRPLIVAAPASGSGKTAVALGLMGALRRSGNIVAPFKVGPDFIDPGHHASVCERPSYNLDGWMCGRQEVVETYSQGCREANAAIVEGVMGLFDGASGISDVGSTAEVSRWLNGRVLLVIDARSQARSAAALIQGFVRFAPDLDFAGIILNRVGSDRHATLLREAIQSVPGLPPILGLLPKTDGISLMNRHLGLITAESMPDLSIYERLSDWIADHVNMAEIGRYLCKEVREKRSADEKISHRTNSEVRLGVARDEAFCFYYPENLERLQRAGARLVYFSPLADSLLPPGLDGIYLGGGYPELHVGRLAANRGFLKDLRAAALEGTPIYAECGGLMLLAESIDGTNMAGILPGQAKMLPRRRALGYRQICLKASCLLGPAGTIARGHEFHYSEIIVPKSVERLYAVKDRCGQALGLEGFQVRNVLGSYIHLHFASNPLLAENFVRFCAKRKKVNA